MEKEIVNPVLDSELEGSETFCGNERLKVQRCICRTVVHACRGESVICRMKMTSISRNQGVGIATSNFAGRRDWNNSSR